MYYIKIALTVLFLFGTFSFLIYSLILFIKFLGKRVSKRDAVARTFLATFCSIMFISLSYLLWQVDLNIKHWIFFLGVFATISFMIAIASIAPYWAWKE